MSKELTKVCFKKVIKIDLEKKNSNTFVIISDIVAV